MLSRSLSISWSTAWFIELTLDELTFLQSPEIRAFIAENEHADVQKLVLNPPKLFKDQIRLIADQIISRRKLKNKLPKWLEADAILPPPLSAEQASSEATAQYKSTIFRGDHLVDLTGGTGVDTLALSSQFAQVEYIERDPWLCELFLHNQQLFTDKHIKVHQETAEEFLQHFNGKASFYLDPARRNENKKVFLLEDCQPNLLELMPVLVAKSDQALIKLSPMMDIKEGLKRLSHTKAVHVVSVKNECKEVLFHLDFRYSTVNPMIHCINIKNDSIDTFEFTYEEERDTQAAFGESGKYLYDPNASLLKAGAFNILADRYGLNKISSNTHLYTSDQLIDEFPGRCFEVIYEHLKASDIKVLIPEKQANVIAKNYPLSSDALRNKLKLKEGGEKFIIGFGNRNGAPKITFCKRLF
ncbi:MAG: class I SAM-dependent methyltransferase [Bacteroidota bacterium]